MAANYKRRNFFDTLYANKKIIFLVGFLLLAVLFVVLLYTFRYNNYKDIYFTDDQKGTSLVYTDLQDLPIELTYAYTQLDYNDNFSANNDVWFSKYYFQFSYQKKQLTVNRVSVVVQLHSNWMDYRYLSSSTTLSNTGNTSSVTVSPKRDITDWAFFPFKMKYPTLFIKITIDDTIYYLKDTKTLAITKIPIFHI